MSHRDGKGRAVVYIYYTHHKDGHGKLVFTELKLTSHSNKWQISWKNQLEDALFKICNPLLKMPPIAMRSYDVDTKVWSYMEHWGEEVLKKIETATSVIGGVKAIPVPDLASLAVQANFNPDRIPQNIRPEDFFYQQAPLSTPALSKEQVAQKLSTLLGIPASQLAAASSQEVKKIYRSAALKFHPDRNGGDGSQMSELNMLWQVFNG